MLIGREQQLLFLLLLGHMTQIWYIPIAQLLYLLCVDKTVIYVDYYE
jgi:hypothetical protein